MKVHKSENILPRFIVISVIPTIFKKSGRTGICHSLCDRFLGKILLFHMAVHASRLTYATNYYFDISDRPLFQYQKSSQFPFLAKSRCRSFHQSFQRNENIDSRREEKLCRKRTVRAEIHYCLCFFPRVTLRFSLLDYPRDGY